MPRVAPLFLAPVLLPVLCACQAERRLVIRSDPPGALVRLDDAIVGATPYERRFDAYGTRRVTLYHAGYRPATKLFELRAPWYAEFPFDLISEVLFPVGWKDVHEVSITLEPESGSVTVPDLDAVLERAESLRLAEPSGPRPSTRPAPPPAATRPPEP